MDPLMPDNQQTPPAQQVTAPANFTPAPKSKNVVSWAVRRQLVYLLIVFVIVAGAGYGVFTKVGIQPTCTDGIKNQNEPGIDCGGVCSRVCANEVQDLRIEWSKVFSAGDGTYDAAALIANPNLAYGLGLVRYRFLLFDGENKLLAERDGDTFINPGEKFALYEPGIATGVRVPLRAFVQFENPDYVMPWQRAVLPVRPVLTVDESKLHVAERSELVAQLANRSVADAIGVQAIAVLFDKDEVPLGIRSTYLDALKINDSVPVSFSWPTVARGGTPAQGQVYPRSTVQGIK